MFYLRLIQTAHERFRELPPEKCVLILHPQFQYHTLLLDALLSEHGSDALCINLPDRGATLTMLWARFSREVATVHDVTLPPLPDRATPAAVAEQFCQAIRPLLPLTVTLTAYDSVDDTVHEFVASAVQRLGRDCRFLIAGRTWPHGLVQRLPTSALAVLPVAPDDMLVDYLAVSEGTVLLEVHALGTGQVLIDGRPIRQWDGVLPRSLFFYFVDRGMTTRDEIFATFWPELSTREATNVFHVTKRKISEILGVDLTVYTSGFYRIAPKIALYYDVVAFAEAVQNSAVAPPEEAEILLGRAIALHHRVFLRGFEHPWADRRREELVGLYVDALCGLGRLYGDRGDYAAALGFCSRAFGIFPQREDLARAQMQLHQQLGEAESALQVYRRLETVLRETLGVEPGEETRALAEAIRKGG